MSNKKAQVWRIYSRRLLNQALLITLLANTSFILSSCGIYGSSFSCKDAAGLYCTPVSVVDQKINSGEIIEVELKEKGLCKGMFCSAKASAKGLEKPDVKANKVYKVKLFQEYSDPEQIVKPEKSLENSQK